jgi:hypothetical protein
MALRPLRDYITLFVQQPLHGTTVTTSTRDTWFAGVSGKPLPGVVSRLHLHTRMKSTGVVATGLWPNGAAVAWYGKDAESIARQTLEGRFHHERGVIPRRHAERLEWPGDMSAVRAPHSWQAPASRRVSTAHPPARRGETTRRSAYRTGLPRRSDFARLFEGCAARLRAAPGPCMRVGQRLFGGPVPRRACTKVYLTRTTLAAGAVLAHPILLPAAMQKLGVRVDAAKFGALAPADETLTADTFSEPVRASVIAVAEQLRDNLWSAVERDRKLNADTAALMRGQAFMPEFAVEQPGGRSARAPARAMQPWASCCHPHGSGSGGARWGVLVWRARCCRPDRHPLLPEPFRQPQCGAQTAGADCPWCAATRRKGRGAAHRQRRRRDGRWPGV